MGKCAIVLSNDDYDFDTHENTNVANNMMESYDENVKIPLEFATLFCIAALTASCFEGNNIGIMVACLLAIISVIISIRNKIMSDRIYRSLTEYGFDSEKSECISKNDKECGIRHNKYITLSNGETVQVSGRVYCNTDIGDIFYTIKTDKAGKNRYLHIKNNKYL